MIVRAELQALREDNLPQRRAQADLAGIMAAWRASRLGSGLEQSIQAYARGELLEHLPPLARLFAPGERAARHLADEFIGKFAGALRANPWGQVPVPSKLDDVSATIVLAAAGNAVLVLQALDGAALQVRRAAPTASFSPGETHDHILGGAATARCIELTEGEGDRAELSVTPCELAPGSVARRDGSRQSLLIDAVSSTLVILRLQRRPANGSVTREFNLADGTLAHQATANPRESRFELAAALLGRMGRRDAAPLLAAMAEEQGGQSLRWQALKESLGLNTAAGFAALSNVAARPGDALAASAGALRAQLIATYPELAEVA